MEVAIDRDSVHAGDDLGSHATSITLDPSATLRALIEVIQDAGYLDYLVVRQTNRCFSAAMASTSIDRAARQHR